MDIRKYFTGVGQGTARKTDVKVKQNEKRLIDNGKSYKKNKNENNTASTSNGRKRKPLIFDSDSDDDESPVPIKKKSPAKQLPQNGRTKKKSEPPASKLVPVNTSTYFGSKPVERNDVKISSQQQVQAPIAANNWLEDFPDDSDFEETLKQIDKIEEECLKRIADNDKTESEKKDKIHSSQAVVKTPTPKKKSSSSDLEKSEERKNSASKYREYLNRPGPRAPGSKLIPEGEENCLARLTFVITGVLDSLERDEAAELVKKYGGKVTQSISKNTSFMVVGCDAGPSKLEKAKKLGTKQIDENGLLELIKTRKGIKRTSPSPCSSKIKPNAIERKKSNASHKLEFPQPSVSASKSKETKLTALKEKSQMVKNDTQSLLWVEKYKPTSMKQIIGQQGEKSNIKKLLKWLQDWHKNNDGLKKKKPPPSRWSDDGTAFKAALLSGPPGVGKTTSAKLVCEEAGFACVELNASDTRSKRSLEEIASQLLGNRALTATMASTCRHCLIMDEVDGMAGNEDRGGVQELIKLIKASKVPIICLCNDRQHPKIRSLSNYCFDLRFQRPRVEQIKGALMSICFKENVKINPQALQEIIVAAQQDIRQTIHHLSLWSVKNKSLTAKEAQTEAQKSQKHIKLSPFDACRKAFDAEAHKSMSIHDKSELFFYDYSISPLFVQENYINMKPESTQNNKWKQLKLLSRSADSICDGDLVEKSIRSSNNWSLLPVQAIFSSVIPGDLLKCKPSYNVSFPSWLGKNSHRTKFDRLAQELALHMRLRFSGNKTDINLYYIYSIRDSIANPLRTADSSGVPTAVSVMEAYDLLREDWDNVVELSSWPGQQDLLKSIPPKVKAAFTRAYNNCHHLTPYSITSAIKNKKQSYNEETNEFLESEPEEEEEEDDGKDAMIVFKSKSKRKATDDSNKSCKKSRK